MRICAYNQVLLCVNAHDASRPIHIHSMPLESLKNLAHQIVTLRNAAGLSQKELARRAGVAVRSISEIENGSDPRVETILAIAGALGVDSVSQLFSKGSKLLIPAEMLANPKIKKAHKQEVHLSRMAEEREMVRARSYLKNPTFDRSDASSEVAKHLIAREPLGPHALGEFLVAIQAASPLRLAIAWTILSNELTHLDSFPESTQFQQAILAALRVADEKS